MELWDALDRVRDQRCALARELRAAADGAGTFCDDELRTRIHVVLDQISWCEREETELFLRAFWIDLGTLD